jgi:hypothetical protein
MHQSQNKDRQEAPRSGTVYNDNVRSQTARRRRLVKGLPWAWIALSSLATLTWLAGIAWLTINLFRWIAD